MPCCTAICSFLGDLPAVCTIKSALKTIMEYFVFSGLNSCRTLHVTYTLNSMGQLIVPRWNPFNIYVARLRRYCVT
jgi:hypothetical protein